MTEFSICKCVITLWLVEEGQEEELCGDQAVETR